ncbi:MAG: sulfurtransferase [Bacillales bacterium]|nr:sulfurtransferase [Bacillales bacterium]
MVELLILFIIFICLKELYKRYHPVKGIPCIDQMKLRQDGQITFLDIRDYNEVKKTDDHTSLNIPYAYLKRFYKDIPQKNIHLIAQDPMELNLGIRFLARKGFKVISYSLSNCPCDKNRIKGVAGNGI